MEAIIRHRANPGARRRDRDGAPLDRALFAELGPTGILAESLPLDLGGGGAGWRRWGQTLRWLAYVTDELSLPIMISVQQAIATQLVRSGRPDLVRRYVPAMMRGDCFGGFAWSEGADPFSFRTVVERRRDTFVLSGKKSPIMSGMLADFFVVYARDPVSDDVLALLVERGDLGVSTAACDSMGLRSGGLGRVSRIMNALFEPRSPL
ncbi:MAG: acyl-CoA dehydrogenase family protein, partial [Pseudonocardia sp.]|nr:acyl-CoA dehydrogenase family protein [Pseudonocardia sp.]